MKWRNLIGWVVVMLAAQTVRVMANGNVHLTYHWHQHQPIYWPEYNNGVYSPGANRYQFAYDSIQLKFNNQGNFYAGSTAKHPQNQLWNGDGGVYDDVFSKADRVNAYQHGMRDSISTITGHPYAGVSISYSGSLQENIGSLGRANFGGYGPGWNQATAQARSWTTADGKPRADLLGMTYHHAFSPLLPTSVLRKEIEIFREAWWKSWGGNPDKSDHSKGFWPIECAFSRHMIPILKEYGYEWSVVANSHLARTCQNYLDIAPTPGSDRWNNVPPNRADRLGPFVPAGQWWSGTLDGRGGTYPAPFAYRAHKAQYIDPETGAEQTLVVVPMCDTLSYQNGFSSMSTEVIDNRIEDFATDPGRPVIVLMAHDGDNAWGGGSSYYFESVPGLMNEAASKGYVPSTIEHYLNNFPRENMSVVHVEDGSWVNADDRGSASFYHWCFPPQRNRDDPQSGYNPNDPKTWADFETPGFSEDFRNWAVIVAGANYLETAEQLWKDQGGTVQAWKIQEPTQPNGTDNQPNMVEQAWHFYLGGLDSGFMYYGSSLDDETKQSLAQVRALDVDKGNGSLKNYVESQTQSDTTPPSVFKPQRYPWNPGGKDFGNHIGYRSIGFNGVDPWASEFYVWTHAFDVSGMASVTLKVRFDDDGVNRMDTTDNETYAGGSEVSEWIPLPMQARVLDPAYNPDPHPGDSPNDPSDIHFFIQPHAIATYYFAKVNDTAVQAAQPGAPGLRNRLVDYYIEATDQRGNLHRSEIQHVFVEDDGQAVNPPGTPANLAVAPDGGGTLALSWDPVPLASSYRIFRAGQEINSTGSTLYSDTGLPPGTEFCYTIRAVNGSGESADSDSVCATTDAPPPPPATPVVRHVVAVSHSKIEIEFFPSAGADDYVIVRDGQLFTNLVSTIFEDAGLLPESEYCYQVAARNSGGTSQFTSAVCATTPALPPTPPFVLDGNVDQAGYRVSNPGMNLYAAAYGDVLYLATWSPGIAVGQNDHFLLVTTGVLASASSPAPWGKAGVTALPPAAPFIGAEADNGFVGWFNAPLSSTVVKSSSNGGLMEGMLNLRDTFGDRPKWVYVCSAAYQTPNNGVLAAQAPGGDGNGDLDPAEFYALHIPSIQDQNANGTFGVLDPAEQFRIEPDSGQPVPAHSAPVLPGATYQWQVVEDLGGTWQNLGAPVTIPPGQTRLAPPPWISPSPPRQYLRLMLVDDGLDG